MPQEELLGAGAGRGVGRSGSHTGHRGQQEHYTLHGHGFPESQHCWHWSLGTITREVSAAASVTRAPASERAPGLAGWLRQPTARREPTLPTHTAIYEQISDQFNRNVWGTYGDETQLETKTMSHNL